MRGESIELDECQGVRYVKDLLPDLSVYKALSNVDLSTLSEDTPLSPCGVLSKYVFTDRFFLYDNQAKERVAVNETNIVNDYDKEHVFKPAEDADTVQWLNVTNGKIPC